MMWALIVAAGLLFHLLMRWMESKGWVYWTKSRRKVTKAAVGPLFDLFQPTRHVTVQEEKEEKLRRPVLPDEREK